MNQDQVVPLGGNRLPKGLEGASADWKSLPEAPVEPPVDYGEIYSLVSCLRTENARVKQLLTGIAVPMQDYCFFTEDGKTDDAKKAHEQLFKQLNDVDAAKCMIDSLTADYQVRMPMDYNNLTEDTRSTVSQGIEAALNSLRTVIKDAKELAISTSESCGSQLQSGKKGKEIYGEFSLALTVFTRTVFAHQAKLLGVLKCIKKDPYFLSKSKGTIVN